MTNALAVIREPESAAALLDPARLRIMEALGEPDSSAGVARRLKLPRQRVNYHLRELERQGLVEFVEEKKKGNCLERLVRATARYYVISPEVLGGLGEGGGAPDRLSSAYLIGRASKAIGDVARLRDKAAAAGKSIATLTLETTVRFRSAADRNAFAEELAAAVAKLAARYHNEGSSGGRAFQFITMGYPNV